MSSEVFNAVKEAIVELTGTDDALIVPDATFNDLNLDSLSMVELIIICEERFDIRIEDDDAATLKTVDDAVSYISTQLDSSAQVA